ncbi:hypothetical protein J4E93_008457 [Alternaria ventricosa]|uniref:uncharacterized protein n=1 Tax=Alternaria ventricosa TaxID=1187951 RepID=UPI0020C2717B|nr:uncharacterized protein J4E93_008457 [Alternaria ventricosa]KAI4640252.1 hypothetical protein J4E93_008457 [Alternaria ventricosa]
MSEDISQHTDSAISPAYEVYRESQQPVGLSLDAQRLKWALDGPLYSAIEVMQGIGYDANIATEPYGDKTASNTTWHSVSQSPLTEPKTSSVIVHIDILEDWEFQWLEMHRFCHDPEKNGEDPDEFLFGELQDYSSDLDKEEEPHLLRCCRANRPRKKCETLLVKASGAFLTIHDYVSAVHPWLLRQREDIFGAEGDLMKNESLVEDTKLMPPQSIGPNAQPPPTGSWPKRQIQPIIGQIEEPLIKNSTSSKTSTKTTTTEDPPEPTASPREGDPMQNEVDCYGGLDQKTEHTRMDSAIHDFCIAIGSSGDVFKENYFKSLTYTFYHSTGTGVQILISLSVDPGCQFKYDYDLCYKYLEVPVNSCQCGGVNGKQGGFLNNDCYEWRIDPQTTF